MTLAVPVVLIARGSYLPGASGAVWLTLGDGKACPRRQSLP